MTMVSIDGIQIPEEKLNEAGFYKIENCEVTYKIGDVFKICGLRHNFMITQIGAGQCMFISLFDGNRKNDVVVNVKNPIKITEQELRNLIGNNHETVEHVGNVRDYIK